MMLNNSRNISGNSITNKAQTLFLTCYVIVAVIGLIGNLLTCYVIIKHKHFSKLIHYYTLNMAVADLLVIVFYVPVEILKNENNMTWTLGEHLCRFNYCVIPTSLVASICTLVAITIDRHRGVTKPLHWRGDTTSMVKFSIPFIWLLAIAVNLPLMFVVSLVEQDPVGSGIYHCLEKWNSEGSEKAYWITMFSLQVVVPLCIMIVLNAHMFKMLQKYQLRDKSHHKKMIRMTVVLVGVYAICTSPQHIFYFWWSFGNYNAISEDWQVRLFKAANLFIILQMALNPVIYGTLGDLQRSFKNGLCFTKFYAMIQIQKDRPSINDNEALNIGTIHPLQAREPLFEDESQ